MRHELALHGTLCFLREHCQCTCTNGNIHRLRCPGDQSDKCIVDRRCPKYLRRTRIPVLMWRLRSQNTLKSLSTMQASHNSVPHLTRRDHATHESVAHDTKCIKCVSNLPHTLHTVVAPAHIVSSASRARTHRNVLQRERAMQFSNAFARRSIDRGVIALPTIDRSPSLTHFDTKASWEPIINVNSSRASDTASTALGVIACIDR
ncbi:unnamed protein product [Bodo saltans]|uniref:Uncharacterized protein n=1 Tax=Bodo saltans TaxID=75058 RepID=A0A0S4J9C3_BODSA|nr:unnamed protein product [Bodo saltans]|eukprot:CUG86507.1 unnamed protein product [Bodo saltans]